MPLDDYTVLVLVLCADWTVSNSSSFRLYHLQNLGEGRVTVGLNSQLQLEFKQTSQTLMCPWLLAAKNTGASYMKGRGRGGGGTGSVRGGRGEQVGCRGSNPLTLFQATELTKSVSLLRSPGRDCSWKRTTQLVFTHTCVDVRLCMCVCGRTSKLRLVLNLYSSSGLPKDFSKTKQWLFSLPAQHIETSPPQ